MGSCSSSSSTKSESDEHINQYSNIEINQHEDESGVRIITHLAENEFDSNKNINSSVDQILPAVRSFLMKSSIQENLDIIRLQDIARDEVYWISILTRLINKIELNDPLGSEGSPCVCHASKQIPRLGEQNVLLSIRRGLNMCVFW